MQYTRYIVCILLVVLGSCGGKDGKKNAPPSVPSNSPLAQQAVDQNGGVIEIVNNASALNGFRMEIPQGALAGSVNITAEISQGQSSPTNTLTTKIGPDGTKFSKDVPLNLPIHPSQLQKGDDPEDLMVTKESTGGVIEIDTNPGVDVVKGIVHTTTDHLSDFTPELPRDHKLFSQEPRFYDGTRVGCVIPITHTSLTPPFIKTEYHPILVDDLSGLTIIPGKGSLQDFRNSAEGNVVYVPGLGGNPGDSFFDEQGQPNDDDILAALQNDPRIKNLLIFQYPSGWTIPYNARAFVTILLQGMAPYCRFIIIGHSMGGLLARYAIEKLNISPNVDALITLGTPHEGGMMPQLSAYVKNTHIASLLFLGIVPGVSDVLAGGTFLTDLNANFPGNKLSTTEYFLVVGTLIDTQGNPTGNDGFVDFSSAKSTRLGVPQNYTLTVAQDHGQLPHNARNNGVWIKIREWIYKIWGINQSNLPPLVNAGQDQTVTVGTTVTLTGTATDPERDPVIKTEWRQISGPTVTLASTTTLSITFTATQPGDYVLELTAQDPDPLVKGMDTVTITVNPPQVYRQSFRPTYDTHHCTVAQYNAANPNRDTYGYLTASESRATSSIAFWSEITFGTVAATIPQGATIVSATIALEEYGPGAVATALFVLTDGNLPLQSFSNASKVSLDVTAYIQRQVQNNGSCFFGVEGTVTPAVIQFSFHSSESTTGQGPTLTIEWQ